MGICIYLLYPEVIMNLLLGTSCFKSLAEEMPPGMEEKDLEYGHLDTKKSRMTMLPDEYCFDENYMSRYGYIVIFGILVYVFFIPIYFMWTASKSSKEIYKAGILHVESWKKVIDEDHSESNLEASMCKFGFFYSGLTISKTILELSHKEI